MTSLLVFKSSLIIVRDGTLIRASLSEDINGDILHHLNGVKRVSIFCSSVFTKMNTDEYPYIASQKQSEDFLSDKYKLQGRFGYTDLHGKSNGGHLVYEEDVTLHTLIDLIKKNNIKVNLVAPLFSIFAFQPSINKTVYGITDGQDESVTCYMSSKGIAHVRTTNNVISDADVQRSLEHVKRYVDSDNHDGSFFSSDEDILSLVNTVNYKKAIVSSFNLISADERESGRNTFLQGATLIFGAVAMLIILVITITAHEHMNSISSSIKHRYGITDNIYNAEQDLKNMRDAYKLKVNNQNKLTTEYNVIHKHGYPSDMYSFIVHSSLNAIVLHGFSSMENKGHIRWSLSGVVLASPEHAAVILNKYEVMLSKSSRITKKWRDGWLEQVSSWTNRGSHGGVPFSIDGIK